VVNRPIDHGSISVHPIPENVMNTATTAKEIYFELHHVSNYGVFGTATIATDDPIESALKFIRDAESTIITQLECGIIIADGCALDVHRHDGEFVVTNISQPAFYRMPISTGKRHCAQMLKIYGA
jgi:hypothetical protein